MKTRPLTSDDRALIRALQAENGWGAPPNSPDLNPVDYSIRGAHQLTACLPLSLHSRH